VWWWFVAMGRGPAGAGPVDHPQYRLWPQGHRTQEVGQMGSRPRRRPHRRPLAGRVPSTAGRPGAVRRRASRARHDRPADRGRGARHPGRADRRPPWGDTGRRGGTQPAPLRPPVPARDRDDAGPLRRGRARRGRGRGCSRRPPTTSGRSPAGAGSARRRSCARSSAAIEGSRPAKAGTGSPPRRAGVDRAARLGRTTSSTGEDVHVVTIESAPTS
jgi:hypothetical protein